MDILAVLLGASAIVAATFITLDWIAARRRRFGGHIFDRRDRTLEGLYRRAEWAGAFRRFRP